MSKLYTQYESMDPSWLVRTAQAAGGGDGETTPPNNIAEECISLIAVYSNQPSSFFLKLLSYRKLKHNYFEYTFHARSSSEQTNSERAALTIKVMLNCSGVHYKVI